MGWEHFFPALEVRQMSLHRIAAFAIGCVWVFHGFYSKVYGGIPRHKLIVGRVLGDDMAQWVTPLIGVCEILLGIWFFTPIRPRIRATVQTAALVSMNTFEMIFARDLLLHPPGMIAANIVLIAVGWWIALRKS